MSQAIDETKQRLKVQTTVLIKYWLWKLKTRHRPWTSSYRSAGSCRYMNLNASLLVLLKFCGCLLGAHKGFIALPYQQIGGSMKLRPPKKRIHISHLFKRMFLLKQVKYLSSILLKCLPLKHSHKCCLESPKQGLMGMKGAALSKFAIFFSPLPYL